jgi:hypothetical protein
MALSPQKLLRSVTTLTVRTFQDHLSEKLAPDFEV